jgi:hypothetical protein
MSDPHTPSDGALPEGDDDPNLVYIAVGRAIHSWEGLEMALARLYLKMKNIPETPDNFANYGATHRRFVDRMAAVNATAAAYFIRRPDQEKEGTFCQMIENIYRLSIDRHRIAHGQITMVAEFVPEKSTDETAVTLTGRVKYRWNPAFYSTGNLRTGPFGVGSKGLNMLTEKFKKVHNELLAFTESILP